MPEAVHEIFRSTPGNTVTRVPTEIDTGLKSSKYFSEVDEILIFGDVPSGKRGMRENVMNGLSLVVSA